MKISFIVKYNASSIYYYKKKGFSKEELLSNGKEIVNDALFVMESELVNLGNEVQMIILGLQSDDEAFEEVSKFKPDIVYIGSYFEYYGSFLKELKSKLNCKTVSGINRPLEDWVDYKNLDAVITGRPFYVDFFREMGLKSEEAIVGFPNTYQFKNEKDIELGFIGAIDGVFTKIKYHNKRTELVKYLSKKRKLEKWGYGFLSDSVLKSSIKKVLNGKKLYQNFNGEVWGEDMFHTLNRFEININCHAEIAGDFAMNNRMFETTGANSLLMTDDQKYLSKYFEPDFEVVTYKSKEECLEKINFLLNNKDELEKITAAGNKRTLENYTVKHYVLKFNDFLANILKE